MEDRHESLVEGRAARRLHRLQPEREGPHSRVRILGAANAGRTSLSRPLTWDEVPAVDPAAFTLGDRSGQRSPGSETRAERSDEAVGSLDGLLDLSARQEAAGLGEAPWPPRYPQAGRRAARVMPSRRRMTMPLIEIARAAEKDEALGGLARWSNRHPDAARHLEPDDVLVDAMRGRYTTWTRVRSEPAARAPKQTGQPQEALDPDYSPW